MSNELKTVRKDFYVKFKCDNPTAHYPSISTPVATGKKPSLHEDEICVKFSLNIPMSLFVKPMLQVTGDIPDTQTKEVQLEVAETAKVLLENSLGLKVSLSEEG